MARLWSGVELRHAIRKRSARGGGRPGALAVASPSGARSRKQGFTLPGAATQTHRPGPPPAGLRISERHSPPTTKSKFSKCVQTQSQIRNIKPVGGLGAVQDLEGIR